MPHALAATPAGEVFGHLVRMNDGPATHERPKLALERALAEVDLSAVWRQVGMCTQAQSAHTSPSTPLADVLNARLFHVPVTALAGLMGFAPAQQYAVADWMRDFVACLSPLSTPAQLAAASEAARQLVTRMEELLESAEPQDAAGTSLVSRVQRHAASVGWEDTRAVVCNLVGLLSQTYEATAGLIGNTLVALSRYPDALHRLEQTHGDPVQRGAVARMLADEVCRFDAPIQNTRRFVAQDAEILGQRLRAGDAVLLLLASANRDAAGQPRADEWLLERDTRNYFSFGRGAHACPGRQLALTMAASVVAHGDWQGHLDTLAWTYRPSVNARIPLFTHTV